MRHDSKNIPDWQLERYLLGELSSCQAEEIRKTLKEDEALKARLFVLEKSNREILTSYPVHKITEQIRERFKRETSRIERSNGATNRRIVKNFAFAVSTAAFLMIIFFPLRGLFIQDRIERAGETTRLKGLEPHLIVYRKRREGAEQLKGGDTVREHDVLQLGYVSGGRKYGVIFSIDGRGVVMLHYPYKHMASNTESPRLEQDGEATLAFSYELDDAPAFERFFLISSHERFNIDAVEKAVKLLASNPEAAQENPLDLPSGLDQFSFLLRKEAR